MFYSRLAEGHEAAFLTSFGKQLINRSHPRPGSIRPGFLLFSLKFSQMSTDYLEQQIFDLSSRIEGLESEIRRLKDLIPDYLERRLKKLEAKAEELESSIDDLENS